MHPAGRHYPDFSEKPTKIKTVFSREFYPSAIFSRRL
jgi:hypothetical protein